MGCIEAQGKPDLAPGAGSFAVLRMTALRAVRAAGGVGPYEEMGTSSGASRHLPRARGRLGRAHRDVPLQETGGTRRAGCPHPAVFPARTGGAIWGSLPTRGRRRTSSGASRHLPRAWEGLGRPLSVASRHLSPTRGEASGAKVGQAACSRMPAASSISWMLRP